MRRVLHLHPIPGNVKLNMMEEKQPFQLKTMFSEPFLRKIAAEIRPVCPAFPMEEFLKTTLDEHWPALELKQRMRQISQGLRRCLPPDFREALAVLVQTVETMLARDGERMTFEWCIFPDFVEAYGTDDPDASLPALETLTRLASAEFAVRPFLLKYPERMMEQMLVWARHPSPLVRRLASEGFRPRLPWGMGVPHLKADPSPVLPVLERLKNDPAETVRRSVANHLNDISKDHPALALNLATRWLGESAEVDWVVRHACRGLLKKGDSTALALFGFEKGASGIEISGLQADASVQITDILRFSFFVKNTAVRAQNIRLEYAIYFKTVSGGVSRKVFKIKELNYGVGEGEHIERRQRFQDFTTRKHFAGQHRLEILANGEALAEATFEVLARPHRAGS